MLSPLVECQAVDARSRCLDVENMFPVVSVRAGLQSSVDCFGCSSHDAHVCVNVCLVSAVVLLCSSNYTHGMVLL